ncbi:MAG: hypothetical protein WD717_03715 [Nitrosarchaeum sp.]
MTDKNTKRGLLLFLLDYFKEVKGRTRIQKMLYLTDKLGWNTITDYYFYQYGPYSEGLKRELELLVRHGLIEENEEESTNGNTLYEYKLTPNGSKYLQITNLGSSELIKKTEQFLEELRRYSTADLEIMTSLYHLKKSDPEIDSNERLIKFVKLYKPWFDESKIQKNLKVFDLMEKFVEHPTIV